MTASRLAFHTLEALEAVPISDGTGFKTNPPVSYGARHALNNLSSIVTALCSIVFGYLFGRHAVAPDELAIPRSSSGLFAYYRQQRPGLAEYRCFAPGKDAYKALMPLLEQWRLQSRRGGFFALLNYPPHAAPTVVRRAEDMLSTAKRMEGIIMPAGPIPSGGASRPSAH